jgi:hypothetical protein
MRGDDGNEARDVQQRCGTCQMWCRAVKPCFDRSVSESSVVTVEGGGVAPTGLVPTSAFQRETWMS